MPEQSFQLFFIVTLLGFFYSFIPSIVQLFLTLLGAASKDELNLMNQITELKKKMNTFSIVDEFARYARMQREISKLRGQLKTRGMDKNMYLLKIKYGSTLILYLIYVS